MAQKQSIKRICVYGIGGVGGYFGSRIAHSINEKPELGYECYFIARGAHLEAIRHDGIRLVSPEGTLVGVPSIATDDINKVPDPDLILICVKSFDLDSVVRSIRSKVGDRTVIVPLLNGADIYDRIRTNLESGIVLPACVFVGTHIQQPGVIQQNGGDGQILFGKDPRHPEFSPDTVVQAFDDMGVNYQWNDDPFPAIWRKYIFIASFGLVTASTGKCLGEVMEDDASQNQVRGIMREIFELAKGKGIDLPESLIEESIGKASNFPYDARTSYQRDVESKGNVNEGDIYGGTIIREADALGIPVPVTSSVYAEI